MCFAKLLHLKAQAGTATDVSLYVDSTVTGYRRDRMWRGQDIWRRKCTQCAAYNAGKSRAGSRWEGVRMRRSQLAVCDSPTSHALAGTLVWCVLS